MVFSGGESNVLFIVGIAKLFNKHDGVTSNIKQRTYDLVWISYRINSKYIFDQHETLTAKYCFDWYCCNNVNELSHMLWLK